VGVAARLAELTRGGVVESMHDGTVVVAGVDGSIRASAGDPDTFAYFRSSAKPFQAIPIVESGAADTFGFTPAELALCCASHSAEPTHQSQVLAMLAKLGLDDTALQCGIPLPIDKDEQARIIAGQRRRSPLQCDCSGKHAGMLASSIAYGYPIDTYLEPQHPLQQRIRNVVAEVCRVRPDELRLATDGCSVPTFGTSVRTMAVAFATLSAPARAPAGAGVEHAAALDRLRSAMTAHPENVGGSAGRDDTDWMRLSGGQLVAKTGAEGLLCLGVVGQGIGIAIRIADGSFRTHPVIAASVLRQLNLIGPSIIDEFLAVWDPRLFNHNHRHVGEIRAVFELKQA
jgi:L-asparaginase II